MNLFTIKFLPVFLIVVFLLTACSETGIQETQEKQPNIVLIFLDDSGWADFEPFREGGLETPNVKQLAAEGCSFQNFYVPQAICSASRASLMTGCYPGRTKVFGAHPPKARGLTPEFATMGEVFKSAAYATAVFGKWHLGDQDDTRPHVRGFDESCGLMFSNDMWKHHPESPEYWGQFLIEYWVNGKIKIADVDKKEQKNLTKWYTENAVDFIQRKKDNPFLLYVPHSMPHVPLFVSEAFEDTSGMGLYWDVLLELDWSIGQINQALKDNGIAENTIFILTSDNGPWISYGNRAGLTPFREAKGTTFDGGIRSACIVKYPPEIKAGTLSKRTFFSIDLLPSLCHLTGVPLPENEIDGKNVWDLIVDKPEAVNPQQYYAFSNNAQFQGVMSGDGKWKLHLPHYFRSLSTDGRDGMPGKYVQAHIDTSLFNMEYDPYEQQNLFSDRLEIAVKMLEWAKLHQEKFYGE
ncbi:MAG: sulfatase [Bacteroidota bacterium]